MRELHLYCMLVIIEYWEIMWDFDIETCEMDKKLIISCNFNVLKKEIVLRVKPIRRITLLVC